jgi:hypothetical protein
MKGFGSGCLLFGVSVGVLLLAGAGGSLAQGGGGPEAGGSCTLAKGVYTCNWERFREVLAAAKTVHVETQGTDRPTLAQLRKLAEELGKTVVGPDEAADMTFLLIPMPSTGVEIGPAGQPLATLRIYSNGEGMGGRQLVWAEVVTDQADKPWGSIVYELIAQFRARVEKK